MISIDDDLEEVPTPDTGWVEHEPMDILTSQLSSAVELLAKARVRPRDVVALGIANQRETTIVWDRGRGTGTTRSFGRIAGPRPSAISFVPIETRSRFVTR
jgi:glycerol kinase